MAFLHTHSVECFKSELELFSIPPTQTTIEKGSWVQYKPISSLTDGSTIEFVIPGSGDNYLDLAHTMLNLKVKMVPKRENTPIDPAAGPVNNLLHSLFSQIDVHLNNKLISPPNNAYAYRAYIETLLNYGSAAKSSHLQTVLWYADTPGHMESSANDNVGLKKRRDLFADGKTVDLIGHPHIDIFNQEKFLLNGVELKLRFTRSREAFCMIDPADSAVIKIVEASVLVRRVKISPGVLISHAKALAHNTAKYPLTKVEVRAIAIHRGVSGETLDNVILGQLPKRLILAFTDNTAYNGSAAANPFNFKNYGINHLALFIDGMQVPSKALQPDFENGLYIEAYHTLFSGTGMHFSDSGNCIGRDDYAKGFCLMAFDLTSDLSANDDSHFNLIKNGSVRIEVRFATPLTQTINCIIYGEYDSILEIDASRQVMLEYSA